MGDRIYASITIGGRLDTIEQVEALIEAACAEDLFEDAEGCTACFRGVIECPQPLALEDDSVNYGTFDRLEKAIARTPGLVSVTKHGGGAGFAESWLFIGAPHEERKPIHIPTNDGEPVLLCRTIKAIGDIGNDAIVRYVRREMEIIDLAMNIPPLTASPAVAAWLKIFGGKAA